MEKILTVTVPAYNAQEYLENCLNSMCIPELLDLLEVIVVDDGSTDDTGQIAERYRERFPQTVRVIHKANGGHGSGINCGIEAATGRYFKVVDADDWVDCAGFVRLLECLSETAADMVVSGFYWAYDDGGKEDHFRKKAEIRKPFPGVVYGRTYDFDEIAHRIYIKMHGLTIRTAILKDHKIRIDENCFYVDTEYVLFPIPYVRTVCFTSDFVYQYRIGRSGQSVNPDKMVRLQSDYDRVLQTLFDFYSQCLLGLIPCSAAKQRYIARMIARTAVGKMKILLSMPFGEKSRSRLVAFERRMKRDYPAVYKSNRNLAVHLLRLSRYRLYPAAVGMLRLKNRRW